MGAADSAPVQESDSLASPPRFASDPGGNFLALLGLDFIYKLRIVAAAMTGRWAGGRGHVGLHCGGRARCLARSRGRPRRSTDVRLPIPELWR